MEEFLLKLAEASAVALALVIIFFLVDIIRKKYRETEAGDRRRERVVVDCPNHIEGLAATLVGLSEMSRDTVVLQRKQIELLQSNSEGIKTLVASHAPVGGREWWKTTSKAEEIQEDIRDGVKEIQRGINELVRLAKTNGGRG